MDISRKLEELRNKDVEFEYAYSHDERRGKAICNGDGGEMWFSSFEKAEAMRKNDLRWRLKTFVIARVKASDTFPVAEDISNV